MSIALSSNEAWRYWLRRNRLKDDKGRALPAEKQDPCRPHFMMRHLTGRQQRKLAEALDALEACPKDGSTAQYVDLCFTAARAAGIEAYFAGNAATPIRFDGECGIEDIAGLGYREASELAYTAFGGPLTAGDLGNSDSPSSTAGDSSAKAASPAEPTAKNA